MSGIIEVDNVYYLPSGRIFVGHFKDDPNRYKIEFTEMRDVAVDGKLHKEVREEVIPEKVWPHLVSYEHKWLLTVSTQMGCTLNCSFCDVAPLEFKGNLAYYKILEQVIYLLESTPYVTESNKVKIGFARMGEPAYNLDNVLKAIRYLPVVSNMLDRKYTWLPCFNTVLPFKTDKYTYKKVLREVVKVKEEDYDGFLHLQLSCNSTDEEIRRKKLFRTKNITPIKDIIKFINDELEITNRTVTLNFIVMKDIPVDVDVLMSYGLNPEKFVVKLIPLNRTDNSVKNNLETYANYKNYEDLVELAEKFKKHSIPVIYDAIARCEEAGLCCGQLVNTEH